MACKSADQRAESRRDSRGDTGTLLDALSSLQAQADQLEAQFDRTAALATLGTLAAGITHELNNILTPIMSYAQLALSNDDPELSNKALRKAIEGCERASKISCCVLGFVRDEEADATNLGHAVRDALGVLARDLSKDGIRLDCAIDADHWVAMRPTAIQHVLLNLIINAREAMLPRGGTIAIEATRSTWNVNGLVNSMSRIVVRDSGCGMPADLLATVFEPFVTRDNEGTARQRTGLGLTICRRLVEEAGGSIRAESTPGEGTRFLIDVPTASTPTATD